MKRNIYTREELQECFRINANGELERLDAKHSPNGAGWSVVECKANHNGGYCTVGFRDTVLMYHRIMWILTHGTIGDANLMIDHISGDKLNNKIENLRLVTNRENCQNKKSHRNGRLPGCYLNKQCGKWRAGIEIIGKNIHLGYYDTEAEAHKVYNEALTMLDKTVEEIQEYFRVAQFSSGYKGVSYEKQSNKWKSQIVINSKRINLGRYTTELEASQVYLKACELIGEYIDNRQFRNLLKI